MSDVVISDSTANPWTTGRVVGYTVLIVVVYLLAQIAGLFALAAFQKMADPAFDLAEWIESGDSNGLVLSVSIIGAAVVCCPFIFYLVRRAEPNVSSRLGIRKVSIRSIVGWCAVLVMFIAASDLLTVSLGRPIVPDVVVADFLSGPTYLFFLALILFAPLFEELFFRGFLMGSLQARGLGQWSTIFLSAALFAVIHIQYDLYGMLSIFGLSLLLGLARWKSGSIFPCLAMHSMANLIAYSEAAILARSAAA